MLLVAIRDRVYRLLDAPGAPDDPLDLYRRLVVGELQQAREAALGRLRRSGLATLDLVPEALTAAVLNRYLAIRHAAA